jgi:hypothetical protein
MSESGSDEEMRMEGIQVGLRRQTQMREERDTRREKREERREKREEEDEEDEEEDVL